MRELTVRIRFTRPCLGDVHDRKSADGRMVFSKTPDGKVMFLPSWHKSNMRVAAQLLGRHQTEVEKILWDVAVDGVLSRELFRRYYNAANGKRRYAQHEALYAGQVVGLNCFVPSPISDDDFIQLLNLSGRYKGLSPFKPGEFGHFEVVGVAARRGPARSPDGPVERTEVLLKQEHKIEV